MFSFKAVGNNIAALPNGSFKEYFVENDIKKGVYNVKLTNISFKILVFSWIVADKMEIFLILCPKLLPNKRLSTYFMVE